MPRSWTRERGFGAGTSFYLRATGVEAFSDVLEVGVVYRVISRDTYLYHPLPWFWELKPADAAYATDSKENFAVPYDGLRVDGRPIRELDSFAEDRHTHRYEGLVEGAGRRIAFTLRAPDSGWSHAATGVQLEIEKLTSGAKTARMRQLESAQELERVKQREEQKAKFELKVEALRSHVSEHGNFFDRKFCEDYLARFPEKILKEHGDLWRREYRAIFSDPALAAALTVRAPEVLEWHKRRLDMVLAAERGEVILPPTEQLPALTSREVTVSTLPYVEQTLAELYRATEELDRRRKQLAEDRREAIHRPVLERASRSVTFCCQELSRFGIKAATPEEAERQFFDLCPRPQPTVYEEFIRQLKAGQGSPDALCERLEDLYRERIILQARRRASIRNGDGRERDKIDQRLAGIRVEGIALKGFLESINCPLALHDPRQREQEESIEEQFMRLYAGKKRVIDFLLKEGDSQTIQNVENLYAQEQAKLFEQDEQSYT